MIRAIQGHSHEAIRVRRSGFWDDFQGDYHQVPSFTIYERLTIPFAMLTHVPVELENFEPFLIDECIFHWTDRESIRKIFDSGFLRAGRDAIYFVWNCTFAKKQRVERSSTKLALGTSQVQARQKRF